MARQSIAGVALRPVMDLSDGRVIAYDASPRMAAEGAPAAKLLDVALAEAAAVGSAPFLVHITPSLLVDPAFDPFTHLRAANCAPAEVVFMLPEPRRHPAGGIASRRGYAHSLGAEGYRVGLDGVGPLTISWEDVVDARPAFLLMEPQATENLDDETSKAALAGLLAFCGRLGARLVAQGVDTPEIARSLMEAGVYYGIGDHLHRPVVIDPSLAQEGDLVVRPSWFKERSVRRLPTDADEDGVHFVPAPPRTEVIDDRSLATLLTEWSGVLSTSDDPDGVLESLADIVPQLVGFDRLAIFEADWDRYVLKPRILVGEALQALTGVTYTLNMGITGWAFLRGLPYSCGRTGDHPEAAPIPEQDDADESLIVIPLVSGDRRLGVLDIWRDGADQFTDHDLERAVLLGKLGADAWTAAEQRAELAERVVTDTLTGLLNKRWWEELANREAAQALRTKSSIAVLLVDLDGFKKVNDSLGHAGGDSVLKQVARTLNSAVRSGDAVIRFGGDEFVLLLRDCDESGALEVADEVQLALSRAAGPVPDQGPVTASIGIAIFPDHGPTLEDVVMHADAAMYRAKALGRDRIAFYSADSVSAMDSYAWQTTPPAVSEDRRPQLRRELEEQCRQLQDAQLLSHTGSFEMDLGSGTLRWSVELRRILAVPPDEEPTLGAIVDRVHPEDFESYAESIRRWVESGESHFELEFRIVLPGGRVTPVFLSQFVRELPDGRRVLTGILKDLDHSDTRAARHP